MTGTNDCTKCGHACKSKADKIQHMRIHQQKVIVTHPVTKGTDALAGLSSLRSIVKTTIMKDENGEYPCFYCKDKLGNPQSMGKHVKLTCTGIKRDGKPPTPAIPDPTSEFGNLPTEANQEEPDPIEEENSLPSDLDDLVDLEAEASQPTQAEQNEAEQNEAVQNEAVDLHPDLYQSDEMKEKCPHVAIHRKTGLIVCLSDGYMSDLDRFWNHCSYKTHSKVAAEVKQKIGEEAGRLTIPHDAIKKHFEEGRDDNLPLPYLKCRKGYKCLLCPRFYGTEQSLLNNHGKDHEGTTPSYMECCYHEYYLKGTSYKLCFEVHPDSESSTENDLIHPDVKSIMGQWHDTKR